MAQDIAIRGPAARSTKQSVFQSVRVRLGTAMGHWVPKSRALTPARTPATAAVPGRLAYGSKVTRIGLVVSRCGAGVRRLTATDVMTTHT